MKLRETIFPLTIIADYFSTKNKRMLSRVADTIYWMARYMERTNGMLQIMRTYYISSQDDIKDFTWTPLLKTYGTELTKAQFKEAENDTSKVFEHLIVSKENVASAYNNIRLARENARAIQDHITKEVWQTLNNYYHFVHDPEFEVLLKKDDPITAIDMLIRHGLLFTVTIKNTMTRDEGYTFLHIGKFLERAIITTDVLRMEITKLDNDDIEQSPEPRGLKYLLYSLLGYEIYIKTYNGNFSSDKVLELVVHNTFFPHSLIYSLYQVNKYFERLKTESLLDNYMQLEFLIGKTMNSVKYSNLQANNNAMLNSFLLETRSNLIGIGQSFSKHYFGNT